MALYSGDVDIVMWLAFLIILPRKAATLARNWNHNFVRMSVCLSVRPSVTRVFCDETKGFTADILTPYERAITVVF